MNKKITDVCGNKLDILDSAHIVIPQLSFLTIKYIY
jgi:hypothetical protein